MPVIRYPDGTEVWTDEVVKDDEPPAHLRRGRFNRTKKNGEDERQRLERGLGQMGKVAKEFLLADDDDDVSVIGSMLRKAGIVKED